MNRTTIHWTMLMFLTFAPAMTARAADGFADASALRCQAAGASQEARALGCVAGCDERAGKATARGDSYDQGKCQDGCWTRYSNAIERRGCSDQVAPTFASALESDNARALACHAKRTSYELRLALCRDTCGDDADGSCSQDCQSRFDRLKQRLTPDGDCPFVTASRLEYQASPFAPPAAPPQFVRGTVATPNGVIETDLEMRDGTAIFDGDIVVDLSKAPPTQLADGGNADGVGRASWFFFWDNVVPFEIDPSLPGSARVTGAMAHWMSVTKFKFKVHTTEPDFIRFVPGTGCSSKVGRQGGKQLITLEGSCSTGNVIHEIGHAIGLFHEQSRSDRDKNVTVIWWNIQPGRAIQFKTWVEVGEISTKDFGGFDWNSVMLYDSSAFALFPPIPSMVKKSTGKPFTSQRNGLSVGDLATLKAMYGQ